MKYAENMKSYIGNCINSFDLDGDCVNDELPYSDTTDFAQDIDSATEISKDEFISYTTCTKIETMNSFYRTPLEVYIAYNDANDIHYFYN